MQQILETERLIIRKFNLGDDAFIFKLVNSPGWLKFIGDRHIKTPEDAKNYIANGPLHSYNTLGFGSYLVQLKQTHKPIGMCSLIRRATLRDVDIGFAFLDGYTGKGYAYEASVATLDYAVNTLGIKKIVAITDKTNNASINLLKKLGLHFEKMVNLDDEELLFFSNEAQDK